MSEMQVLILSIVALAFSTLSLIGVLVLEVLCERARARR